MNDERNAPQKNEMHRCRYLDENHSFLDGYFCGLIDEHVDWCDGSDICSREDGYEGCPYYLGSPVLTDDICDQIRSAVASAADRAQGELDALSEEMSDIIRRTGMESLGNVGRTFSYERLSFPEADNLFGDCLHLRSEEERAGKLMNEINRILSGVGVAGGVIQTGYGQPVVCSEDFTSMSQAIRRHGCEARECFSGFSCGLSGDKAVFGEPVDEFMSSCAGLMDDMVRRVQLEADEAGRIFESGIVSAVSQANGSGGAALSDAGIQWIFGD